MSKRSRSVSPPADVHTPAYEHDVVCHATEGGGGGVTLVLPPRMWLHGAPPRICKGIRGLIGRYWCETRGRHAALVRASKAGMNDGSVSSTAIGKQVHAEIGAAPPPPRVKHHPYSVAVNAALASWGLSIVDKDVCVVSGDRRVATFVDAVLTKSSSSSSSSSSKTPVLFAELKTGCAVHRGSHFTPPLNPLPNSDVAFAHVQLATAMFLESTTPGLGAWSLVGGVVIWVGGPPTAPTVTIEHCLAPFCEGPSADAPPTMEVCLAVGALIVGGSCIEPGDVPKRYFPPGLVMPWKRTARKRGAASASKKVAKFAAPAKAVAPAKARAPSKKRKATVSAPSPSPK